MDKINELLKPILSVEWGNLEATRCCSSSKQFPALYTIYISIFNSTVYVVYVLYDFPFYLEADFLVSKSFYCKIFFCKFYYCCILLFEPYRLVLSNFGDLLDTCYGKSLVNIIA